MSKNQRHQTTRNRNETKEEKSVPAETSSDQVRPEAQGDQQKLQPSTAVLKRLMEVYGTDDVDFLKGILTQIVRCSPNRNEDENEFMISVIKQEKPKKHLDVMLLTQMIAVHTAGMRCTEELARAPDLRYLDSLVPAINKLMGTFRDQYELFKRNQAGAAAQTVAVQNVSVNEGGQAVLTNVMQTPRENTPDKPAAASPPAISHAETAPMSIIEESKERVAVQAQRSLPRYRPPGQRRGPIMDESRKHAAVPVQHRRKSI
jgi:hypothetical protein